MKDNFSNHSDEYVKFRPTYPEAFFEYLKSLIPFTQDAWDCGTGNGQVAYELSKTFDQVFATDISKSQIAHAPKRANIQYSVQPAEHTNFNDRSFDLVIVAQAIHWFNFDKFYSEVRRVSKDEALICVLGYGRVEVSEPINNIVSTFYQNVIGPYWDPERRYIDEGYQTIPFPFEEIQTPKFSNTHEWLLDHFIGYLNTWSAVKHFIAKNGYNPIDKLQLELEPHWDRTTIKKVHFPLLLRIGKVS